MAVAILSGPERRRRWTQVEKLRLVEETLAGEANIAEIARRHDVHPNLLHAWRRQARAGLLVGAVEEKPRPDERVRFAAVAMEPLALPAAGAPSAAGVIEVEFAAGGRMRITGAVEASLVSALIKALAKSKGWR